MRYLAENEMEDVLKLRAEGWYIKAIAKRFEVCEATISNIVNGKARKRKMGSVGKELYRAEIRREMREENFSELPDHVLFQHVKESNFIG